MTKTQEAIERFANDIIATCESIQEICKGDTGLKNAHDAARAAKWHADEMIGAVLVPDAERADRLVPSGVEEASNE